MNEQNVGRCSLNALLSEAGLAQLSKREENQFGTYLDLLLKWNARMNLTAVRQPEDIIRTHFIECIACARALPAGISSLLDLGSGAGFPGLPIAICRPEIAVTLAESQAKKASFLNEVVRSLALKAKVVARRAESIGAAFDCVAMRAVDRMEISIQVGSRLLSAEGWLAIMTTKSALEDIRKAAGPAFVWDPALKLPKSDQRVLALGRSVANTV